MTGSTLVQQTQLPRELKLQTRLGNDIVNCQGIMKNPITKQQIEDLKNRYHPISIRTCPSSIYNCHGLTFAARRTWIAENDEIYKILHEDDYQQIQEGDILPSDSVVYFDNDSFVIHSGIVVDKNKVFNVPIICSKWGHFFEAIHLLGSCPYQADNVKYYRIYR